MTPFTEDKVVEPWTLFRRDWTTAEAFFSIIRSIPAGKAAFLARYGPFENEISVEEFTAALRDVNQVAGELGSPDSLKRRLSGDTEYLLRPKPPAEVYAAIVWLGMQAGNLAHSMVAEWELLPDLMQSAGASAGERAKRAKELLSGNGGLASKVDSMAGTAQQLAETLAAYEPRLTRSILAFHATEVVNQANRAIAELKVKSETLQEAAAKAAAKANAWFGAGNAKEELERLKEEMARCAAEIEKKELLDSDLGDFFVVANRVAPAILGASKRLSGLAKEFHDVSDKIGNTCRLASPQQLGDSGWLTRAIGFSAETEHWKAFQRDAQAFTQNALVSLDR